MFFRRVTEVVIALGVFAVTQGCSKDTGDGEAADTSQEAISGGDTRVVTTSPNLPEVAVPQLTFPNGQCSSSIILRDLVLTAAHCFCNPDKESLNTNPASVGFSLPTPSGTLQNAPSVVGIQLKYFDTIHSLCNTSSDEERVVSDLAIVQLSRSLTVQELAQVEPVYTGGDFLDRSLNSPPQPRFFQAPIEITGFAASTGVRKKGTVTSDINFELTCGFLGLGSCSAYWIDYNDNGTGAHHEGGDSGGPITFYFDGVTPTQFGVTKGIVRDLSGTEYTYSPTWDNGNGNGGFIRTYLVDADNDGVRDDVDNCPPSACAYNVDACANPDQADLDGDNVGDVCDNCDPALCDARGWPRAACANAGQNDGDHDGTGDQCDSCPLKANGATMHSVSIFTQQLDDQDLDGVGDACDNCNKPNGYKACQTNADCDNLACQNADNLGFCVGGETPGTACGASGAAFGECGSGTCVGAATALSPGTNGRCVIQLDDQDGDHLGGSCDACPNDPDTSINSNSNDAAEQHLGVAALGDICDPVPVYVSRPNLGLSNDPNGSRESYTTFFSTAGVGHGGANVSATAGFRYCSCLDPNGQAIDRAHCLMSGCRVNDPDFSNGNSAWKTVSTATNGPVTSNPVVPPPTVSAAIDQRLARFFTSDVVTPCDDLETHFLGGEETCRLGASREILKWFHQEDMARPGVLPTNSTGHATGIFWSHVIFGTSASARDTATNQMLRDDHEYVTVPFVPFPLPTPQGFPPQPCQIGGCNQWWHKSWAIDPAEYIGDPTPLEQVAGDARLLPGPNATIVAVRSVGDASVDVTSSLSQQVRDMIIDLAGQVSWLSPIEPASRGRQPGALVGAVIASPWRQSSVGPSALQFNNGGLQLLQSSIHGGNGDFVAAAVSAGPPRYIPADRDGARALFSSREGSVYMLGGHFMNGSQTHEVWKFDFSSEAWSHVFLPKQNGDLGPAMGDALAVTYDDVNHRMLMVDELHPTRSGHSREEGADRERRDDDMRPVAQLLELDTQTQTMRALLRVPRTEAFERVSLATQDDGSYILVGAFREHHWIAFRFEIVNHRNREDVRWTGVAQGDGEVLDDPVRITGGNLLPVLRNGAQQLVTLSNASFDHSGRGCDSL